MDVGKTVCCMLDWPFYGRGMFIFQPSHLNNIYHREICMRTKLRLFFNLDIDFSWPISSVYMRYCIEGGLLKGFHQRSISSVYGPLVCLLYCLQTALLPNQRHAILQLMTSRSLKCQRTSGRLVKLLFAAVRKIAANCCFRGSPRLTVAMVIKWE